LGLTDRDLARGSERPPEVTGRERGRHEADEDDTEAAQNEAGIPGNRLRVIEIDPAVDLEPGLHQPPEAGRINQHEGPVDPWIEPGRGPAPQEEPADEEQDDR